MQNVIHSVTTASEVIQLAIAPVFLLMGVSTLLGVLTGRLGRLVDRFRALNEKCESPQAQVENPSCANYSQELHILSCRAKWVHWAITLCTLSLLLVAIVIGVLFLGSAIRWHSSWLVAPLFIATMLSLIIGLGCFLREIHLSKHTFELQSNNKS
ncbi:MAG TPA: DUF2721 domain-containing protein [Methylotenera sp.]|nr:DUF2721 domain-containing protein [Methylotenera sp.]